MTVDYGASNEVQKRFSRVSAWAIKTGSVRFDYTDLEQNESRNQIIGQLGAYNKRLGELARKEVECRRAKRPTAEYRKLIAKLDQMEVEIENNIIMFILAYGTL